MVWFDLPALMSRHRMSKRVIRADFGMSASCPITLKFQVGGWRAAYVHLALTVIMAGIPLTVLLIGRAIFWINDQFRAQ
jgi:hypothetical protein